MKRLLITIVLLLVLTRAASAQILHGEAPIVNGNIQQARDDAKKNALRDALEVQIGVMVKSKSVTVNSMLLTDEITANAQGYASVKGIVKEGRKADGTYFVDLDAELSPNKIVATANDLKARIAAVKKERGQFAVAIAGKSGSGNLSLVDLNNYVAAKLQDYGFVAQVDDNAREYIDSAFTKGVSATQILNEARRIVKESGKQGIFRGELSVIGTVPNKPAIGWYSVTVKASFQLVRTDNDTVNSYMNTFTAYGQDENEAERNALEIATKTAIQDIAQKVLDTVQEQQVGGETVHEYTVRVINIISADQRAAVIDALEQAGCEVVNESQSINGDYVFAIESTLKDIKIKTALIKALLGIKDKSGGNASELGAKEIVLTY